MPLIDFLQASPTAFIIVAAILGLLIGSFLNVVIHRLPLMMEAEWRQQCAELAGQSDTEPQPAINLITPRSRCPHCGHAITALENIPVLSYLALKGACSACGKAIGLRYPLVEALTGALTALVAWHFGWGWQAAAAGVLTWALIALSLIDFDHQLLPDSITQPFLWLGLTLSLYGTAGVFTDTHSSIIGALAGYLSLWLVYQIFKRLTGKEGMGYGDFKLLALFGAWLGWQMLPAIILLSSLVGAAVGITLILVRGRDRNLPIPFGPYLAAAGWIALLWGGQITQAYLQWAKITP
jgi:leader peptidase (prepilin peptidase) / N-methyltransferase